MNYELNDLLQSSDESSNESAVPTTETQKEETDPTTEESQAPPVPPNHEEGDVEMKDEEAPDPTESVA